MVCVSLNWLPLLQLGAQSKSSSGRAALKSLAVYEDPAVGVSGSTPAPAPAPRTPVFRAPVVALSPASDGSDRADELSRGITELQGFLDNAEQPGPVVTISEREEMAIASRLQVRTNAQVLPGPPMCGVPAGLLTDTGGDRRRRRP